MFLDISAPLPWYGLVWFIDMLLIRKILCKEVDIQLECWVYVSSMKGRWADWLNENSCLAQFFNATKMNEVLAIGKPWMVKLLRVLDMVLIGIPNGKIWCALCYLVAICWTPIPVLHACVALARLFVSQPSRSHYQRISVIAMRQEETNKVVPNSILAVKTGGSSTVNSALQRQPFPL